MPVSENDRRTITAIPHSVPERFSCLGRKSLRQFVPGAPSTGLAARKGSPLQASETGKESQSLSSPRAPEGGRLQISETPVHHIVIVGGGAGGIELATKLGDGLGRRKRAQITLVERTRTHIWKPHLHEVAAGTLDVDREAVDYLAQAANHHFRYCIGEMIGLDRVRREVQLAPSFDTEGEEITPARSIHYDTLVIAVGSTSNDFGTRGAKEFAIALDTQEQAVRFHQRLVNRFIRAHAQPGPVRSGQLHVAIIGAGATGTELAAELHRTTRQIVSYGLDRIDPDEDLKITLLEAADRILPGVPPRVSEGAHRLLRRLGIDVRTGARAVEVRADGVLLADGDWIESELVVWAAGVKGPDFLAGLDDLETNRNNQLVVTPTLMTTRDSNVFASGDCAFLVDARTRRPIPPRAQAAHQQATHLADQLRQRLEGKPLEAFRYQDFGSLVSLGEYTTVGNLMGFLVGKNLFIEGYFARLIYRSLYKQHQFALHGFWKVLLDTIARTLTRRTAPRVKLH